MNLCIHCGSAACQVLRRGDGTPVGYTGNPNLYAMYRIHRHWARTTGSMFPLEFLDADDPAPQSCAGRNRNLELQRLRGVFQITASDLRHYRILVEYALADPDRVEGHAEFLATRAVEHSFGAATRVGHLPGSCIVAAAAAGSLGLVVAVHDTVRAVLTEIGSGRRRVDAILGPAEVVAECDLPRWVDQHVRIYLDYHSATHDAYWNAAVCNKRVNIIRHFLDVMKVPFGYTTLTAAVKTTPEIVELMFGAFTIGVRDYDRRRLSQLWKEVEKTGREDIIESVKKFMPWYILRN